MARVMAFLSKVNGKYENQSPYQVVVKHDWVRQDVSILQLTSTATPKTPINQMTSNCL